MDQSERDALDSPEWDESECEFPAYRNRKDSPWYPEIVMVCRR